MIAGLAAVVGPVLGGQLAGVTDWRGFFVVLAAIGALILGACVFIFRETLPETNRTTGGLVQTGRDFARLLSDRVLLGTVLISGLISVALFAYLAGTASALLGLARFGIGGLAAPLVGIGGSHDALPLGLVTIAAALLAGVIYVATIRGRTGTPDTATLPAASAP